ncbi:MAG TPA: 6-phosphogluconolactonase [Chitinophagaceae bacterium]|nr:6-phosphogluconolactonase [Chitinophagaceae bacterium]
MHLTIYKDLDALSEAVAEWITELITETLKRKDHFSLALSGGSTPKSLYQLLAGERFRHRIAWEKIHFFWGDERYVPFEDDRNNARMAFRALLDHVPVVKEQVHIMQTDVEPQIAAADYEQLLRRFFAGKKYTFDLILLGLGDNAHTLSLFPGRPIIHEKTAWVQSFYLDQEHQFRISLTVTPVNNARKVAFLVSGGSKAAALFHVLYGEHDPDLYPAQVIQPYNEALYWFVDEAAASDIER